MGCTNKRAIELRGIIKFEGPTDGDMACQSVTYVFVSREHKVAGLRITMCFSTLITNPIQNRSTGLTWASLIQLIANRILLMIYESKPTILIPCNSPYLIPFHHIIIHVISLSSSSSQLYCPSFWKTYSLKILGIHSLTNLFVLFYLDDLNSWHQFRSYPLICYREFDKNFFLWYVNVCVGKESNEWSDQQR